MASSSNTVSDSVSLAGIAANYVFRPDSDGSWTVTSSSSGAFVETLPAGTNEVRFAGQTRVVVLAPTATDNIITDITTLYAGVLGRSPENGALAWYAAAYQANFAAAGISPDNAIGSFALNFAAAPETVAAYAGLDTAQIVTKLFSNLLNRAPEASDITFYGDLLSQGLTVGNIVLDVSQSPEFKDDLASATSSAPVQMIYADQTTAAAPITATQALSAAATSGIVDFNDIAAASLTGVISAGATGINANYHTVSTAQANLTITLADNSPIQQAIIVQATGDTVNGARSGHSYVEFDGHGGTVNLSGNGNSLIEFTLTASAGQTTNPLIVNGWASTDGLQFQHIGTTLTPVIDLLQQQSTPIVGGSGAITNASFGTTAYVVQTAPVADLVLADLVKVATSAYTPSQTASSATTNNPQAIVFLAQDGVNTVAFHWTDNGQHQITTATIDAVVELVGVAPMTVAGTLLP